MPENVKSKRSYYLLVIFLILSVGMNIFIYVRYFYLKELQIGELRDTFNVYKYAVADTKNIDSEKIVDYMVYVKTYYPAGTKFIPRTGELAEVTEESRSRVLFILKVNLEKRLGIQLEDEIFYHS